MRRSPLRRRTTLRGHRRKKSLRKQLWPEFSRLIRKRDGRCLMAGQGFGECGGVLQCSHIHGKGAWPLLELFPLNAKTLCYRHHIHVWHTRPVEVAYWLQQTLPDWWLKKLEETKLNSLARKGMSEDEIRAEWRTYGLCP